MSFRASVCGYALAVTFGAASLLIARGQGQAPVSPQQTNSPAAQQTAAPPKDRLKDLEDELSKALERFSPKGMLEGKPEPQFELPPVVIPNRHLKEERDKRKNWMFMEQDDLLQDKSTPDWLNPFTKDTKKKTDLDSFYERLNQQRSILEKKPHVNPDDLAPLSNLAPGDESTADNDERLPDTIRGPAGKLRDLLGFEPAKATPPRNSLSDLLGLNQNKLTPEQMQAHRELMDQYRKVLAGSPPAATPLNSATLGGNSQVPAAPGGLPTFTPSSLPTTPGMVGSIYNPTIIPDRNATLLNQWNPLYAPPKVEPPKPAPVVDSPVEAPRRRF